LSGISSITKGILTDYKSSIVYKVLPYEVSVNRINKKLNVKVNELKTINILRIDNKKLNVQVLNKNINIKSNRINKINIKRS